MWCKVQIQIESIRILNQINLNQYNNTGQVIYSPLHNLHGFCYWNFWNFVVKRGACAEVKERVMFYVTMLFVVKIDLQFMTVIKARL